MELTSVQKGISCKGVLEFEAPKGTNLFSNLDVYLAKRKAVLQVVTDAVMMFETLNGVKPTTIYLHSLDSSVLRDALEIEVKELQKVDSTVYDVPRYGTFWFRDARVLTGCTLEQGNILLVAWEDADNAE